MTTPYSCARIAAPSSTFSHASPCSFIASLSLLHWIFNSFPGSFWSFRIVTPFASLLLTASWSLAVYSFSLASLRRAYACSLTLRSVNVIAVFARPILACSSLSLLAVSRWVWAPVSVGLLLLVGLVTASA